MRSAHRSCIEKRCPSKIKATGKKKKKAGTISNRMQKTKRDEGGRGRGNRIAAPMITRRSVVRTSDRNLSARGCNHTHTHTHMHTQNTSTHKTRAHTKHEHTQNTSTHKTRDTKTGGKTNRSNDCLGRATCNGIGFGGSVLEHRALLFMAKGRNVDPGPFFTQAISYYIILVHKVHVPPLALVHAQKVGSLGNGDDLIITSSPSYCHLIVIDRSGPFAVCFVCAPPPPKKNSTMHGTVCS